MKTGLSEKQKWLITVSFHTKGRYDVHIPDGQCPRFAVWEI